MEIHNALPLLIDYQLSMVGIKEDINQSNEEESKEKTTVDKEFNNAQDELLGTGIEIFRIKNEQVVDFCFD